MASPFQKYQSEQVPQINILPYTQAMAEQTQKAMAGLGTNIGESIKKYQQSAEERDQLAQLANSELSKWVVQDLQNPEDKETYKADENAPKHSADIINLALKEGDGDVAAGMASVPLSKLRGWANIQQKYEKDVQRETENRFKEREAEQNDERIRLAKEDAALRKRELKIREDEAKIRTDENERIKSERDKLEREKKLLKAVQDTSTVPKFQQTKEQVQTIEDIGDIFGPDGSLFASNVMIKDAMQALNLNPNDVVTQATAAEFKASGVDYAYNVTGKYLTQNDKFDIKSGFSGAVQNGYAESFIRNAFKQADAWSNENTGRGLAGFEALFPRGYDGPISNPSKAFELAEKFIKNPKFTDYIKKQGVNMIPDGATFNKAYYTVTDKTPYSTTVVKEIELTEEGRQRIRYNEIARAAGGADKLDLSFEQIKALQPDRFIPRIELQMPDGSIVNAYKMGQTYKTDSELLGVGKGDKPETEAQLNIQSADNWLRRFNKPQDFGNITVQFQGGVNEFSGKWSEDYPILRQGFEDVKQTGQIANDMRKYVNKGMLSKIMDVDARNRFDSLVLRATTYRRYFIAGGQETEPDAQRLFDIVGAMNTSRLVFKDAHLAAINAFEAILRDKVVGQARSNGFRVAVKTGDGRPTPEQLKKIIADVQAENAKQGIK